MTELSRREDRRGAGNTLFVRITVVFAVSVLFTAAVVGAGANRITPYHVDVCVVFAGKCSKPVGVGAGDGVGAVVGVAVDPAQKNGFGETGDLGVCACGLAQGVFDSYEIARPVAVEGENLTYCNSNSSHIQ